VRAISTLAVYHKSRPNTEAGMRKKDKLTDVSVKIGTALGKADKRARKFLAAGDIAKEELQEISKQVEELKKQLTKTTERLSKALR
jgi:seryl-tRNA synthetase